VQYISLPYNNWFVLREKFPGKYENTISPVPDPNDWFHAKVVVRYPEINVFVNHSEQPTLQVEQIGHLKNGKIGIWVGNGSEGWFRNVYISNSN
jgi:hypothetical protein